MANKTDEQRITDMKAALVRVVEIMDEAAANNCTIKFHITLDPAKKVHEINTLTIERSYL